MMAAEGPLLAAAIARSSDATFNLAAHGVAWAVAILVEAPVIMLMSAATALVRDRTSYLKLRAFSLTLALGTTGALLVMLWPPVHRWVTGVAMGLPSEIAELTYGALWLFLPWPAAIAYRRFLQGVLIRSGRTRLVAYGTVIRLLAMSAGALFGFLVLDLPGAWAGALALSTGVLAEAATARLMARDSLRALFGEVGEATEAAPIRYREIARFYLPLALTSLIGLTVQPMLTFFMGRSVAPVESLAVFPVVHALSFFFRSFGLAFQDAAIALMGDRFEHVRLLRRFAAALGASTSLALAAVALTPLSGVYFGVLSGLPTELERYALTPTRILVPLPALTVLLSLQRAILVEDRRTRHLTVASAIEVGTIAVTFAFFAWVVNVVGVTAAFAAFVGGRIFANGYLAFPCREALGRSRRPARAQAERRVSPS